MIGEEVIAYYGDAGDGEELFEKSKLVRCKDCFHYTKRTEHTGICDFWNAGVAFKDFCSMANQEPMLERKNNE